VANSDGFINEVEEELRHDKLKAFWQKWQFLVYAMIAAVILGVGGREAWHWYSKTEASKASDTYTAALLSLQKGEFDSAQTQLDALIKSAPSGYKALALHSKAEVSLRKGDTVGAQKALEEASKTGSDEALQSAAAIKAAYLAMEKENFDQLTGRLKPVIDRKGPFAAMAQEVLAAKALEEGKNGEARTKYQSLVLMLDAPEGVKQRAQLALTLLPPEPANATAAPQTLPAAKPAVKGE
jgi:hypothetical protein